MKKYLAAIACLALLTGCGTANETTNNDEKKPETTAAQEVPTTTQADATTAEPTEAPTETPTSAGENDFDAFEFAVKENGVDISVNGQVFQTLDLDCSELLNYASENGIVPEELIFRQDYNFDGVDDLYIPTHFSLMTRYGSYFRYETGADEYVSWDEITSKNLEFNIDEIDMCLIGQTTNSLLEWEVSTYKWNGDKLDLADREVQFLKENGDCIRENYETVDGAEKLVKRKQLQFGESTKEVTGFIELPLD